MRGAPNTKHCLEVPRKKYTRCVQIYIYIYMLINMYIIHGIYIDFTECAWVMVF